MDSRYEPIRTLGRGGRGKVWQVRDKARGGRILALKRLHSDVEAQELALEFRLLSGLRHPALTRPYDFGVDDEGPYFTSEFVEGSFFPSWAKSASQDRLFFGLASLLRGLALLHRRGWVHADVSGENVLVHSPDAKPVVKLLDLGSARRPGQRVKASTPGWAAPEILEGRGALTASDLYSFGVLAACAFFGRHPFGGENASESVMAQFADEPNLPDPDASPLSAFCRRLLSKDPSKRPPSAETVLAELASLSPIPLEVRIEQVSPNDVPEPDLVGREEVRGSITAALERCSLDNTPKMILLTGPAGSGRTSLLEEACRSAGLAGLRFIGAPGRVPTEGSILTGLLALADDPEALKATGSVWAPWMENSSGIDASEHGLSCSSSNLELAVGELFTKAAVRGPVCLILDDLGRASAVVRKMAAACLRALDPGRRGSPKALIIAAGLTADLPEFADLLGDLKSADVENIVLPPLNRLEVQKIVESMLEGVTRPPGFDESLALEAEGLPARARDLVRAAVGRPQTTDPSQAANRIVEELDEPCKDTLAALDLLDTPCPAGVARASFGEETVSKLCERGLVIETAFEQGPAFHPSKIAAHAARAGVPHGRLESAAAKLIGALSEAGMRSEAAEMMSRIGRTNHAAKIWSELGQKARKQGRYPTAAQWFSKALEFLTRFDEPLALEMIEVFRFEGRYKEALEVLHRWSPKEPLRTRLEADILLDKGDHSGALDRADRVEGDGSLSAIAAAAEVQLGRHDACLRRVREAEELGVTGSDAARLALCAGLSSIYLGRTDEAARRLRKAGRLYEHLQDTTGQLKVSANFGLLHRSLGDLEGARAAYNRAVELVSLCPDRHREALYRMNRATIAHVCADFTEALEDYRRAHDIAVMLGHGFRRTQIETNLAFLLRDLGDLEAATSMALTALSRARRLGQPRLETTIQTALGEIALARGDLMQAQRRLQYARRASSAAGNEHTRLQADVSLAETALLRGDCDFAAELAELTARGAKKNGLKREQARALVVAARTAFETNRSPGRAASLLEQARVLFEAERSAKDLWRVDLWAARFATKRGDQGAAQRALAAARTKLGDFARKVPDEFSQKFWAHVDAPELAPQKDHAPEGAGIGWSKDIELLMEVNRELTRELDAKRLLSLIMERAVELTGAERGTIIMPRQDAFEPVISHRISDEIEIGFSRSIAEQVAAEGRAVVAVDAMGDERFRRIASVNTFGLRSILAVPLSIRRRVIGVIYLDSRLRSGVFSDKDHRLLEAFGAQAAIALETARLVTENNKRLKDLETAHAEILTLKEKLEEKLDRNEAELKRVGALLHRSTKRESERIVKVGLIGRSPAMQRVKGLIERLAPTDVPVYVYGPSGTGKELVARAIHAVSERNDKPFVPINCGALPPKLLASELFGHVKGAFTGAVTSRPGLFSLADKGVLFLDEVADMDPEMQAHLLRVLQDGRLRNLGGSDEIAVDVRVISASNKDLVKQVEAGLFREDLFYRLNVVRIDVPPLSDRREDIPLLVEHFLRRHSGKKEPSFSKESLDILIGAAWPGNVRELENEILRAVAMSDPGRPIEPSDLSPRLAARMGATEETEVRGTLKERVDKFESIVIQTMLEECGHNATKAAQELGISRAGLYKKLEKLKRD